MYARCDECDQEFYQEPGQQWKRLCYECWRELDDNGFLPSHFANLKAALLRVETELARRQDLVMAFKIFLPVMLAAIDRYQGPGAQRCGEWLRRLTGEWEAAA